MAPIELPKIYKSRKNDRDVFHELMPFKVTEILLVATYYDAYSIVREGQFSDKIYGEYLQLNLYSAPRFVRASSNEEALDLIKERNFDLIILMAGMDKETSLELSKAIREIALEIPLVMLVNNNSDLAYFEKASDVVKNNIDRVFVWNGSTKIFMAMTKYIEDKMNLSPDIEVGDVRLILLVEDSVKYYSRYLPLLYSAVMTQTQNLIADEDDNINEMQKILKMRARPKIILASNYEHAKEIIDNYKDNLLCLITDVSFSKDNQEKDDAGVDLVKYVREQDITIPIVMQSTDVGNAFKANMLNVGFINKNSDTLALDINNFLIDNLGFGKFIFKNQSGAKIAEASTVEEFEEKLATIPDESLVYHGMRDGISTWLMVRGEIYTGKLLKKKRVGDFKSVDDIRKTCEEAFERSRLRQLRGRIIPFRKSLAHSNHYIMRLGKGSLGGKGRGLAFISNFIESINFKQLIPGVKIRIPRTSIIGVEEFSNFLEINDLGSRIYLEKNPEVVKKLFLHSKLSDSLLGKLRRFVDVYKKPIAVRSSGLFEDSLKQPFAGVYSTYLLPNNHEDNAVRLKQLATAIKLVYASIFTHSAKDYFKAVDYKIEEEQMAIVIQEVVGQERNGKFYPDISGVAQSYNYYPFSYMKPEDGFAVLAVGLGLSVVGGEKAHRFCPKYPKLQNESLEDQIRDTQKAFYAINMGCSEMNLVDDDEMAALIRHEIKEAEEDGVLTHLASTYDRTNDRLEPGVNIKGPRVIDFADILKYNHIPLARAIEVLLDVFSQAMGTPVEIEFAVDLSDPMSPPTIYLLQIKPLIRLQEEVEVKLDKIVPEKTLLFASKGMGNGTIESIQDVIYVDITKFDHLKTREMAKEVELLNRKMKKEGKEYILIGPGRWGTRDKHTGIPVYWAHISNAKIIVEQGLENFPLDASLGSHFFHNVISMNVGYYSVQHNSKLSNLNYEKLESLELVEKTTYFRHVRFQKPVRIAMDGKSQNIVISFDE